MSACTFTRLIGAFFIGPKPSRKGGPFFTLMRVKVVRKDCTERNNLTQKIDINSINILLNILYNRPKIKYKRDRNCNLTDNAKK